MIIIMRIISEHKGGPLWFFNIIGKSSSVKILLNKVDDDDNDDEDDIIMALRHRHPFSQFLFLGEAA